MGDEESFLQFQFLAKEPTRNSNIQMCHCSPVLGAADGRGRFRPRLM